MALIDRGQMPAEEVTLIMWQLLHALKFLHSNNVWHRYDLLNHVPNSQTQRATVCCWPCASTFQ